MIHGQSGYRPDIDGMRAIAVGLVVVFHFHLLPLGEAGFVGVDIFFVISGFLITRIILNGQAKNEFRLGPFYLARMRRLYPALLTTLLGYLAAGYVLFLPDLFRELAVETALSQLYVVNIYFWRSVNYFGLQAGNVPLLHMWSLAVEEQFYILYPIFLILLHRLLPNRVLTIMIALVLASFALGWFASGWKPQAAFYLLPTRAWELLAGGALATALHQGYRPPAALIRVAGPIGLGLIVLTLFLHYPGMPFPGWLAALPVAGSVALLVSGLAPGNPVSRLLSLPAMLWLGKISYALYLVHWPVIILLSNALLSFTYGWRLFGMVLSLGIAWLITRFIETPVRSRRVLGRPGSFLGTAAGMTALLLLAATLWTQNGGAPGRFDPEVNRLLAFSQDQDQETKICDWPHSACLLGPEGQTTVVLFGDSHAQALAGAFDLWLNEIGQPGALMFGSGCLPVPGVGNARCDAFARAGLEKIRSSHSIETVVLASIWRQPYEKAGLVIDGRFLVGDATHEPFAAALEKLVMQLRASGKKVVLVEPLYAAPRSVPKTLASNLAFGRNQSVDVSLDDHHAQFKPLYAAFERAQAVGGIRVSLIEKFCESGICPGILNGDPVFSDNNHIRHGLSPIIAELLAEQIPSKEAYRDQ